MPRLSDFTIKSAVSLTPDYGLIVLEAADGGGIAEMRPGQFVQVKVPGVDDVMLRRPISVHDYDGRTLSLLVRRAGRATTRLLQMRQGECLSIVGPLGNGFTIADGEKPVKALLVGGGVGVAPLLYLGRKLKETGHAVEFLLGARSKADLLRIADFEAIAPCHISTDDGSCGTPGLVTQNPAISGDYDIIYCCGPAPMMKAVAAIARANDVACEVSLENMMACGIGACLCCVEKTVKGNVCVCTEGPVFNINQLTW